jgi:hypothetical protein
VLMANPRENGDIDNFDPGHWTQTPQINAHFGEFNFHLERLPTLERASYRI